MGAFQVTLVRGPVVSTVHAANNEATPCIGLAYVAGYLRARGYDVTIVDAIGEGLNQYWEPPGRPGYICQGLTIDEVVRRVPAGTEVLGFSAMFSGEWPIQREYVTALRARLPDALFVAGGEHTTALPEYTLRDCSALDVCVRGEGEHTFYEVVEAWPEQRDYAGVNGIAFLDRDGRFVANGTLPRLKDVS